MIPDLDPHSDAKILQIFCNPILQTHKINTFRGPTTKCYTFLETLHDPQLESQLRCKNLQIFLQPYFATPEYVNFQRPYPQVL